MRPRGVNGSLVEDVRERSTRTERLTGGVGGEATGSPGPIAGVRRESRRDRAYEDHSDSGGGQRR